MNRAERRAQGVKVSGGGSVEVTFKVSMAEVTPGNWHVYHLHLDGPLGITQNPDAAADIAMLIYHHLEMRRIQKTNTPDTFVMPKAF